MDRCPGKDKSGKKLIYAISLITVVARTFANPQELFALWFKFARLARSCVLNKHPHCRTCIWNICLHFFDSRSIFSYVPRKRAEVILGVVVSFFFPFMTEVLILITMFFTSLGPGIARRWLSFNCANFGRRFKMYATKRRRRTVKTYVSISTFSIPCHTIDALKQWSYVSKRQFKRFESLIYQL